ncbi:MAG TPA: urate hydroxylase PuuD [Terriglobales bacterium]|nr:urate hydroxylase PuuD [Terriglobales bacterium]
MTSFLVDWLNLLIRWGHMVAGISWIGTSFYFIALDLSLKRRAALPQGVYGEAWEVHGGGFYHVQKYLVAPAEMPPDLVWFKWEAYLTWVSGFLLLIVQYYVNASSFLIDPGVLALTPWQAIGISVVSLVIGWIVYDQLCRSALGRNTTVLAVAVFVLILAAAYGFTHIFSGRGALIHVGAFIGTMMAANVFMVIIPNQRKITAALVAGEKPDPALGAVSKQRSVHNTYLTLPVLVMMVSNHYPMITNHPQAWLIVGLIVIGGASARHFLMRHEVGDSVRSLAWALGLIFVMLFAAIVVTAPVFKAPVNIAVSDNDVLAITQARCIMCHAEKPTRAGFAEAPKGVKLETLEEIHRYAAQIDLQAVKSSAMPLGNVSGMTADERAKLGAWIAKQ